MEVVHPDEIYFLSGSSKLRQKFSLFNKYFLETALVINLINVKVSTRLAISLNYDLAGK